jgi:hypothetical protein
LESEIARCAVVVLPAPSGLHQRLVRGLADMLVAHCGPDLAVVTTAPAAIAERLGINEGDPVTLHSLLHPDGQTVAAGHEQPCVGTAGNHRRY